MGNKVSNQVIVRVAMKSTAVSVFVIAVLLQISVGEQFCEERTASLCELLIIYLYICCTYVLCKNYIYIYIYIYI